MILSEQLSIESAKEVASWRYEGIYVVYNFPCWEQMEIENWTITQKSSLSEEFFGFFVDMELIAFGRIFEKEEKVFLSLGLKPSMCGRGTGKELLEKLVEISKKKYGNDKSIALEVRSFNKRAIKCYENFGFVVEKIYLKDTLIGKDEFFYMELIK